MPDRISKSDACYVDAWPSDEERCQLCTMFRQPMECTLVEGDISPEGHCKHFDPIVIRAAGVMFVAPDGAVLLMRPADTGLWAFPGGKLKEGETAEDGALREIEEETGRKVKPENLRYWTRRSKRGVDFTTFAVKVDGRFDPELSDEHDAFRWAKPDELLSHVADSAPEVVLHFPEARLDAALNAIRELRLDAALKIVLNARR